MEMLVSCASLILLPAAFLLALSPRQRSEWHSVTPPPSPGGGGPGQERLSGTIVTGSVLRMLVTLSPKSAVTELQTMRKQFLAKDLSLINQEEKKNPRQSRKRPGVSRTVSQETTLDNKHYHDGHVSFMTHLPKPTGINTQTRIRSSGWRDGGLDCSCADDDG